MNDETAFDRVAERAAVLLSERMTRGHLLAKVGKAMLVIVGTGVAANLPLLPEDRRVALADHCNAWYNCGIGTPAMCAHCGGGGTDTTCPGDCTPASSWTACCLSFGTCSYYVSYQDCCKDAFAQNCFDCSNPVACRRVTAQNWCAGAGSLICTLSIVGAACSSGCPSGPVRR